MVEEALRTGLAVGRKISWEDGARTPSGLTRATTKEHDRGQGKRRPKAALPLARLGRIVRTCHALSGPRLVFSTSALVLATGE